MLVAWQKTYSYVKTYSFVLLSKCVQPNDVWPFPGYDIEFIEFSPIKTVGHKRVLEESEKRNFTQEREQKNNQEDSNWHCNSEDCGNHNLKQ